MNRIVKLWLIIIIVFSISLLIVNSDLISYEYFVKTEFLFTFLGVFIGFSLTLYTYITSMFDDIKKTIRQNFGDNQELMHSKMAALPELHTEIKDNIMFLIYSLIVVVIVTVSEKLIGNFESHFCQSPKIVDSILLTIFILSVYSLKDMVSTSFAISDFIIKKDNE